MSPTGDRPSSAAYRALAVAWSFGWPVAAGVLLGGWLDGVLGTAPLFTLALAIGALATSARQLIVLSRPDEPGDRR